MTKEDVEAELFRRFTAWMAGQTVGINPDGTTDYYDHDVRRFLAAVSRVVRGLPVHD